MLENIAKRLINIAPQYGAAVWAVLCRPVSETTERAKRPGLVVDALAFWLISQVLDFIVRLLIFAKTPNTTLYMISRALQEVSVLVGVSLAFTLAAVISGARMPVRVVLVAYALISAAALPVQTLLKTAMYAPILATSEELFQEIGNLIFSCSGLESLAEKLTAFQQALQAGDPLVMALVAYYVVVGLFMFSVTLVYTIAFLRALGRLSGATGLRHWALSVLGLLFSGLVLTVVLTSAWMIGRGTGAC
ncbi:MAG: hypothetical protein AAFX00_09975 [Pseudomonadota bacterium]